TLALCLVTNLLLLRTAGDALRALGLGCGLLPCGPLLLFSLCSIRDLRCVHQFLFKPAYFSISFFKPKRGKLTVILASSPSPSRRTTVPMPYLGCCTVIPALARIPLATAFTDLAGAAA